MLSAAPNNSAASSHAEGAYIFDRRFPVTGRTSIDDVDKVVPQVDIGAYQYYPGAWHGAGLDYDPTVQMAPVRPTTLRLVSGGDFVSSAINPSSKSITPGSAIDVIQKLVTTDIAQGAQRFPSSDTFTTNLLRDVFIKDPSNRHRICLKVFYRPDARNVERLYGSVCTDTNTWYFSYSPAAPGFTVNGRGLPNYLKSVTRVTPALGHNLLFETFGGEVELLGDFYGGLLLNLYEKAAETNQVRVAYDRRIMEMILPTEAERSATNAAQVFNDGICRILTGDAPAEQYSAISAARIRTWSPTRDKAAGELLLAELLSNWIVPVMNDPALVPPVQPPSTGLGGFPNGFLFSSAQDIQRLPQ